MEEYKTFGSRNFHGYSITAHINGIFDNSYIPMVNTKGINVNNITTRQNIRFPPSDDKDDFYNGIIRYDVRFPNKPYEVSDVVDSTAFLPIQINGDAGTFKESFGMVKNATGRYFLVESTKLKGNGKKEFNPYAKEWVPKSKILGNVPNYTTVASSKSGSSLGQNVTIVDIPETRFLNPNEEKISKITDNVPITIKDKNPEALGCTHRVDFNGNFSNRKCGIKVSSPINTNYKDASYQGEFRESELKKNESRTNGFVKDIPTRNKQAMIGKELRTASIDTVDDINNSSENSNIQMLNKSKKQVCINDTSSNFISVKTANDSDIILNTKHSVPFVVGAPVCRLEKSLIKCPFKKFGCEDITDEFIVYKGNEKAMEKVRKAIVESNIREQGEINNASSLKVDMSFAQLATVNETIENIKHSNGLFMFSPETPEIATPSTAVSLLKPFIWTGLHWVTEPSRWLCVSNFPFESEYYPDLRHLFEAYGDVREIYCGSNGIAYVFYYDIRDAIKAQNLLRHKEAPHNGGRLNVKFSQKPTNVNRLAHLYPPIGLLERQNEGSLIIYHTARANEPAVKAQFSKYGTIKEFKSQTYEDLRVIILEYYDSRNANSAKISLNGQKIQDTTLSIEFHDPSAHSWDIITHEISSRKKAPKHGSKNYPAPPVTSTVHSSGNRMIPLKNQLNLEKIKQGLDARTTFMVRNIPNKYTQEMLRAELDETHKGKYDFLYLRIDFANKCNVGYAFINFVDINAVILFSESRVGRKWACFNSDKICELSYADIQGYPALVEKFKTSSVMRERPEYRPKVFFTSGPMKGMEAPFPYIPTRK
ncbi:11016_t:CDS:2 [Funneliformis caledonium]|uniref:11016_t:CDS:1 n=1 Tax=Funneliformis caledonium TaxID=1117310 RepID=A0A9N9B4S7_9GLOM|nr:11016_t:CDS:2 [Funneliformis caledonium]